MESIDRRELLDELDQLGYSLFRPESNVDPVQTLAKLAKVDDPRLLEGFPIVLANSLLRKTLAVEKIAEVEALVRGGGTRKRVRTLVAVTLVLLAYVPESASIRRQLTKQLQAWDPDALSQVRRAMDEDKDINVGGLALSPERLRNSFLNYVVAAKQEHEERISERVESAKRNAFDLAMSELFSPRQRQIVERLLRRQELSKTEREYYSRIIKRRMRALANPEVQAVASVLLGW